MSFRQFFVFILSLTLSAYVFGGMPSGLWAGETGMQKASVKKERLHDPHKHDSHQKELRETYILGSGDEIMVTVFGEDDLTGRYNIRGGGIAMPLVGELKLEGLSIRDAERAIITALQDGYLRSPSVLVEVEQFRPFYVIGEVRQPGSYEYGTDITVLKAIATAGGYTYRANKETIEILRKKEGRNQIIKDVSVNRKIIPGDVIKVKERFF